MTELYFAAALMGFMGSGHCVAMCGGISSALGLANKQHRWGSLIYQMGRISTYTFAGALTGALGFWIPQEFTLVLRSTAALILVVVAFYLFGWSQAILVLERLGRPLWKRISPLTKVFSRPQSPKDFWFAGVIWGWLPCGLVYSALALSATTAQPTQSALTMFFFGLGTLPSMLAVNFAGQKVRALGKLRSIRIMSGLTLLLMAGWMLFLVWQMAVGQTMHHG